MELLLNFVLLAVGVILIYAAYEFIYDYVDSKFSSTETLSGELIDKRYKGEESSSGVGTAVVPSANGGVGVGIVSTSSYSPEEFLFFVRADKVYKIEVDMQKFYNKNLGEKLKFELTIGKFSNDILSTNLIG